MFGFKARGLGEVEPDTVRAHFSVLPGQNKGDSSEGEHGASRT